VGRLLDWLDRSSLAEDTVVILVSDHGEMAGEHGYYGKKTFYRNSMQVLMLVRYPRAFSSGFVVDSLVDPAVDTMPTLLDICGMLIPDSVQGTSYLPLLQGSAEPSREAIFYEILMEREGPEKFPISERGMRTKEWMYVRQEDKPTHLFDLINDVLELDNIVSLPEYDNVCQRLDKILQEHMKRTDDDWAIEAVFPPPDFQTHQKGTEYARELYSRAIVEP
jgi:arylsulfatase A-like enzyme